MTGSVPRCDKLWCKNCKREKTFRAFITITCSTSNMHIMEISDFLLFANLVGTRCCEFFSFFQVFCPETGPMSFILRRWILVLCCRIELPFQHRCPWSLAGRLFYAFPSIFSASTSPSRHISSLSTWPIIHFFCLVGIVLLGFSFPSSSRPFRWLSFPSSWYFPFFACMLWITNRIVSCFSRLIIVLNVLDLFSLCTSANKFMSWEQVYCITLVWIALLWLEFWLTVSQSGELGSPVA